MATNGSTLTAKDHAVAAKAQATRKLARQRKKNRAKNKGLPHGRKPLFDEIREDKQRQRHPRVANSRTPRPNGLADSQPVEKIIEAKMVIAIERLGLNEQEKEMAMQFAKLLIVGEPSNRTAIFKNCLPRQKVQIEENVLRRFATTCWFSRKVLRGKILPGMERFASKYATYYGEAMSRWPATQPAKAQVV